MNIGVVGSRSFNDYPLLEKTLNEIISNIQQTRRVGREEPITIISGGANGADTWAEIYSIKHNCELQVFEAEWDKYGKKAGPMRNKQIVEASDMIVAFWDGESKGTLNTIQEAGKRGSKVDLRIIRFRS